MNSDTSSCVAAVTCQENVYVVKAHRKDQCRAAIEEVLKLRGLLRAHHFPYLPPPLAQDEEEKLIEFEGQVWSLGVFVEADAPFDWTMTQQWSPGHCTQAAEVLACFHRTGYRVLARGAALSLPLFDGAYFDKTWEKCRSICKNGATNSPALAELALAIEPFAERLTAALAIVCSYSGRLPVVVAHGDFHPGNVLFVDGKAAILLDMEYASIGSPLIDLAYACVMFFASCDSANGINEQAANHFLRHYNESLGDALSWKDWSKDESCVAEFRARMDLAAFLMLFWAIEGLESCMVAEVAENGFAYGARLSCFLLNNSHSFALF